MIIAMPMSRGRLASHFTKAQRIVIYNEYHQLIANFDNPALTGGCSAKKAMLDLIKAQKADIVIVQHIGERMLGKLLSAGISVSKGDSHTSIDQLLTDSSDFNRRMLNASEGRTSLNHENKGGCCSGASGGCGCSTKGAASNSLAVHPLKTKSTDIARMKYSGFRVET